MKVNYTRYADDFVITGYSKELLENEVKPLVREFLKTRGLELSEEKTRITHVEEGFDFLGWNVRKYEGKLLIKPSKENVKAFLRKVGKIVGANKMAKQANLIETLNPVLRGWANYHKHAVSSETFGKVGHAIWRKLWQWSKRRHPGKGGGWIMHKYFRQEGMRKWVFAASEEEKGRTVVHRLHEMGRMKIVRHVKIRAEANPFDPHWEPYLEQRALSKLLKSAEGRRTELRILKKQQGKCPICQEMLGERYHVHRIVGRASGSDVPGAPNLILMHKTCYRQIHSEVTLWQGRSQYEQAAALMGLSRMKRKFHVRFLGGWVAVTPPDYPTSRCPSPISRVVSHYRRSSGCAGGPPRGGDTRSQGLRPGAQSLGIPGSS